MTIFTQSVRIFFGMHRQSSIEKFFSQDDRRQSSQIVHFQKIEKMPYADFQRKILSKVLQYGRLRSKIVRILGRSFFKELPEYEILQAANQLVVKAKGIHDEKRLAEFMVQAQCRRESLDFVQWRIYYFEDYSPNESVFVFKCAH